MRVPTAFLMNAPLNYGRGNTAHEREIEMNASELIAATANLVSVYGNQPIVVAAASEITVEGDMQGDCKSICCEFDADGQPVRFVIYGEG